MIKFSLKGLQIICELMGICNFSFKLADVRCVAHICGLIHQVYGDFNEPLKKGLVKIFDGYGGKDEDKVREVPSEKAAAAEHQFCKLVTVLSLNLHQACAQRFVSDRLQKSGDLKGFFLKNKLLH